MGLGHIMGRTPTILMGLSYIMDRTPIILTGLGHILGRAPTILMGLGHTSGTTPTILMGLSHIMGRAPINLMEFRGSSHADAGPVCLIRPWLFPVYSEWLAPSLNTLQINIYLRRWDLILWQRCCWRCQSSGMWRCVVGWVIADVSKDHTFFIFRVKQSKKNSTQTAWPED
jgi:hypothetical protein